MTWLGLSFEGTPGGTGCPGNGNTADDAKEWLLSKYIGQGYCCSPPPPTEFPTLSPVSLLPGPITCSKVFDASAASLVGQVIGTGKERCVITDATTCTTCACSYYVRYRSARQHQLCFYVSSIYLQYGIRTSVICSTDSGLTWLGLSFEGTPGGSGCPGNGDTADAAKEWLLTKYIGQGYCCSTPSPLAGEIQFQTECMVLWFQSVPFFCQPPLRNPIFLLQPALYSPVQQILQPPCHL